MTSPSPETREREKPPRTRLIEMHRRVQVAMDALQSLERYLARELGTGTSLSLDELAEQVKNATKAAVARGKKD